MTLSIAPSTARGTAQLLQPFYYTSSLFLEPMRQDISGLLSMFVAEYTRGSIEPDKPLQLFKIIWQREGWDLIHLRVLDARARESFLRTVARLFVERVDPVEDLLIRVGAIFGLYTFYTIQPEHRLVGTQPLNNIILSIDTYEQLLVLPMALQPSLRSYVTYIISRFLSLQVFHIIPHTSLEAQNPRTVPHTMPLLTRDIDHGRKKKTGRPSQLAQYQRADNALSALEYLVGGVGGQVHDERPTSSRRASMAMLPPLPDRPSPTDYVVLKERLKYTLPHEALKAAETLTMERMRDAERHATENELPVGDRVGLERLGHAFTQPEGILGLVNTQTVDE